MQQSNGIKKYGHSGGMKRKLVEHNNQPKYDNNKHFLSTIKVPKFLLLFIEKYRSIQYILNFRMLMVIGRENRFEQTDTQRRKKRKEVSSNERMSGMKEI